MKLSKDMHQALQDTQMMHTCILVSTHLTRRQRIRQSEKEDCIQDIRAWKLSHKLKLNDDKTELLLIGSKQQLTKVPELSVKVGFADVNESDNSRNLGVIFDSNMTLEKQVNNINKRAFLELKRIRQIRHYLSQEAEEQLVHSFVSSTIDFCNSLMYGCTRNLLNKIQKIRKATFVLPLTKALWDRGINNNIPRFMV